MRGPHKKWFVVEVLISQQRDITAYNVVLTKDFTHSHVCFSATSTTVRGLLPNVHELLKSIIVSTT